MATEAPTKKTVTKKVATRKAAPKKAVAKKAPAKKAATKAPKVLTEEEKAARAEERAKKAAEREAVAAANREARETKQAEQETEVGRLREVEGMAWEDIAEKLGVNVGTVLARYAFHTAGEPEEATPEKVREARDSGLSWIQVQAKFGIRSKAKAHKLYREAGGDNLTSDIGRGGRFITRDPNRVKAPKAKKATASKGPLFTDETPFEEIVNKVVGKVLTWNRIKEEDGTETAKVHKDSTPVEKFSKANVRSIQFADADKKIRTVRVNNIIKVAAR